MWFVLSLSTPGLYVLVSPHENQRCPILDRPVFWMIRKNHPVPHGEAKERMHQFVEQLQRVVGHVFELVPIRLL